MTCVSITMQSESTFIELVSTKKSRLIIGAIYRLSIYSYLKAYLNPFLENISFSASYFNVDFVDY